MKNNINQTQTTGLNHFSPKRFAFHKNRSPRRWTRLVVLRRRVFLQEPRPMFRKMVLQEDGTPRSNFATWVGGNSNKFQNVQIHGSEDMYNKISKENELIRDEIINNNKLAQVKTITIMATGHVEYNARVLERWLSVLDIRVQIVIGNISKFDDDLYIVMCPQAFIRLPPPMKRIIFQLEQGNRTNYFTDGYMENLSESLAIFDYSSDNVQFLQDNGISYRDIFELTIAPIADYMPAEKPVEKSSDFDVLFYGAYNPRRNKILKRLRKEFRVKSVSEVYGEEMCDIIRQAPVVVNIHFYEKALLETTRISDVLSLGTRVVSERGSDEDKNRDFDSTVRFCPMDDVDALIAAIKAELAEAKKTPKPDLPLDLIAQAKFRFYRAILALGMIDYDKFYTLMDDWKLPSDKIMLGLPENVTRREYAMTQIPEDVHIFDGLRHRTGWIGCAMSYKYMAQKALDAGIEILQIHEDDAEFPYDYQDQHKAIKDYLTIHKGQWDIFSGMIFEPIKYEMIKGVEDYKSTRFVNLNFCVSTVYNIYAQSFLEKLARYPLEMNDTPEIKRHIDRYLGDGSVRCITTAPFLIGHAESLYSSIWPVGNGENHMIDYFKTAQKNIVDFSKAFINADFVKKPSQITSAIKTTNIKFSSNKVAVFYHYFERDEAYRDNLIFFLATGYSPDVDFYIVIAGECSIDLPHKPNISYIGADNNNYDYGGYCQAFLQVRNLDKYDSCIFINSSVRGPFVASYFQDDWIKIYTQWLKDDVHLVGATINAMTGDFPEFDFLTTDYHYPKPYSHVQSTTYAMSRKALQHLLKIGFYDLKEQLTKDEVIALYELRLSQEIKKQGWNMKSLCAPYNLIDYRTTHEEINPTAVSGDPLYADAFFGRTLSPMECVFMKTNRDVFAGASNERLLPSYTYTSLTTNTHPDMADWKEAQQLCHRADANIQKQDMSEGLSPLLKHPLPPSDKMHPPIKKES